MAAAKITTPPAKTATFDANAPATHRRPPHAPIAILTINVFISAAASTSLLSGFASDETPDSADRPYERYALLRHQGRESGMRSVAQGAYGGEAGGPALPVLLPSARLRHVCCVR